MMKSRNRNAYRGTKRLLDVLGAALLLLLLSPLLLLVAISTRLALGKPVFFCQPRPGLNEKIFKLYKFRSMKSIDLEKDLTSDEDRLTKYGQFLRATSLDELPSLWNVLRGDMSFVGPRPLLVDYLEFYTPQQARRHGTRPGITGLAQVAGRNALSWNEKFDLDVQYVTNMSFRLDCKILYQTVRVVFKKEGISHAGNATMPAFSGENNLT